MLSRSALRSACADTWPKTAGVRKDLGLLGREVVPPDLEEPTGDPPKRHREEIKIHVGPL